ncbi:MAG TPA: hypothetical protein VKV26_17085 [Dehalococcoidia bacterium]|nr:hypothetical protein [Dehalococcoidia bacterium]
MLVPDLPVQLVLRQRPDLAGRPVVVGGYPHERKAVADASPEAAASGISPGMALRQAAGLCPAATFLPLDASLVSEAFAFLLHVMESFSPAVEAEPPDAFYLDLSGLNAAREQALLETVLAVLRAGSSPARALTSNPSPNAGRGGSSDAPFTAHGQGVCHAPSIPYSLFPIPFPTARAAGAAGRFTARVAAELAGAGEVRRVPPGAERELLAPVPVTHLPCSAEMQRRLRLFGLRTLGEFAALPFGPVQAQFGREGALMWRLARGEDERPPLPRRLPRHLARERHFDPPVISTETLLRVVKRELAKLTPELQALYLGFRQVTLALAIEAQEVRQLEPADAACRACGATGAVLEVSDGCAALWAPLQRVATPSDSRVVPTNLSPVTCHLSPPVPCSLFPIPYQRTWTLHAPANRPEAAFLPAAAALRELALPGPVAALRLTLHDLCQEEGQQGSLFSSAARRRTQLGEAVRQIEARCGRNLLQRIVALDPRSRLPERRRGLAEFRP